MLTLCTWVGNDPGGAVVLMLNQTSVNNTRGCCCYSNNCGRVCYFYCSWGGGVYHHRNSPMCGIWILSLRMNPLYQQRCLFLPHRTLQHPFPPSIEVDIDLTGEDAAFIETVDSPASPVQFPNIEAQWLWLGYSGLFVLPRMVTDVLQWTLKLSWPYGLLWAHLE